MAKIEIVGIVNAENYQKSTGKHPTSAHFVHGVTVYTFEEDEKEPIMKEYETVVEPKKSVWGKNKGK